MKKGLIISIIVIIIAILLVIFFSPIRISVYGNKTEYIKQNEEYKDKGAYTTFLGIKINQKIKTINEVNTKEINEYKVTYKVKFLNKKAQTTRKVIVQDSEKPVITILGGKVFLYKGNEYNEYGYIAEDNIDKNLTDKVKTSNNIDINKPGIYQVKYEVSDSSNNKEEKTREVEVIEKGSKKDYGLPILMYHFFYDPNVEKGRDVNWLNINNFEEQIKYLKENNFYFPTWKEANDYYDGKIALPEKSIILTSDDGNDSFFTLAKPIIEKYDAYMTSFIIGTDDGEQKVKNYQSKNITYQSHTNGMHQGGCSEQHGSLFLCINYEKGLNDLKESIKIVGNSDVLAYPYGDYNEHTFKLLKDAKINMAVTTEYGRTYQNSNKLKLPRLRISDGYSINYFKNIVG